MSNELIQYAFTGGEISPSLYGRSDLESYDLGLALAKNWITDYSGGLSTRPGQEFCEYIFRDDLEVRFSEFRFSPDLSNVYLLLFGNNYLRFIQDGSYVLEPGKEVTAVNGVFTSGAPHDYSDGDWVKTSEGRTFQVASITSTTFRLLEVPELTSVLFDGDTTVSRIYTLTTPWNSAALNKLSIAQRRDLLRITSPNFYIRNLIRRGHTDWVIELEDIGINANAPTGVSATASSAGTAAALFTVTADIVTGKQIGRAHV